MTDGLTDEHVVVANTALWGPCETRIGAHRRIGTSAPMWYGTPSTSSVSLICMSHTAVFLCYCCCRRRRRRRSYSAACSRRRPAETRRLIERYGVGVAASLEESPFCGGTNSLLVQLPLSGTSSRRQHVDISTRRQSEPAQAANDCVTPSLSGLPQQQQWQRWTNWACL